MLAKGDLVRCQIRGSNNVRYGKVTRPGPKITYVQMWSPTLQRYAVSTVGYANSFLTKIGEV